MIHAFEAVRGEGHPGRYLLVDVESGAVMELDADAYSIAKAIEKGENPYSAGKGEQQTALILAEFEKLKQDGLFDTPAKEDVNIEGGVIKALCLHLAHECNLRCEYCFASHGDYHGPRGLMSFETGKAALDFLIVHSGSRHNLEVDFFGGEPLLNYENLKKLVTYGRELEKTHNKTIRFTLTTNGFALDEQKIEYLNEQMHNVVLSLDGRKRVNDAVRRTADNKGSFDKVLPMIKAFAKARGDKEYYVRGTFTNKNTDFSKDVLFLRSEGFDQISVEPVCLPREHELSIREEHLEAIFSEYDALAEHMLSKKGEWFNFFHFMLDMDGGPCLNKRVSGCGAGVSYVAVTPEGDIYPCHQFVGEKDYMLGNVRGDFSPMESFLACNVLTKPDCKKCWAKYYCGGGCHANAYKLGGDIYKPDKTTCALLKKRTEIAISLNA